MLYVELLLDVQRMTVVRMQGILTVFFWPAFQRAQVAAHYDAVGYGQVFSVHRWLHTMMQ